MLNGIVGFSGTFVTFIVTVVVIVLGRILINKMVKDKRILPYHRQFFTLTLSLLGLFVAVALLPMPTEIRLEILSVLGIFLSAVIALSSTTLVGNAMAGIMLRLMKGFRAGDFIQFDDLIGRITDIALLHTEIQLVTRDIVTVPNSLLIKKAVQVTRRTGTFVNAAVSIGYAEDHSKVEAALKDAAEACGLTEPFVFVDELRDHAVRYRVFGLLEETNQLLSKTSELLKSVLDTLHGRGIEIMSPDVVNRREYSSDYLFVPREEKPVEEKAGNGEEIEEIAFDRAEEAESIEQLYALEEKLNYELETISGGEAKKCADDKDAIKDQKSAIKERLERIKKEITRREKEKEEKKLDESSSQ